MVPDVTVEWREDLTDPSYREGTVGDMPETAIQEKSGYGIEIVKGTVDAEDLVSLRDGFRDVPVVQDLDLGAGPTDEDRGSPQIRVGSYGDPSIQPFLLPPIFQIMQYSLLLRSYSHRLQVLVQLKIDSPIEPGGQTVVVPVRFHHCESLIHFPEPRLG